MAFTDRSDKGISSDSVLTKLSVIAIIVKIFPWRGNVKIFHNYLPDDSDIFLITYFFAYNINYEMHRKKTTFY